MPVTNEFFLWFFYGLGGLGGWFIFLLLAMAAIIWLLYDNQKRRLPAVGWRMAVILIALLILPAMLYRFTVDPLDPASTTSPLYPFSEVIFYLGLLGGVLPPVISIGYYVTFQGLVGCPQGHIYEAVLGQCPECARLGAPPPQPVFPHPARERIEPKPSGPPQPPPKPKAHAWLVAEDGRDYQLNLGETTVGRSAHNDIQLIGDTTVGRQHAKIIEQNGHFKLIDLGTKNYTYVNGRIIRQPMILEPDDLVQFGDNTKLQFVTIQR